MKKKIMRCKKCGGTTFQFRWEYMEEYEMSLLLAHEGTGFEFSTAIIRCTNCGEESPYEQENFTEVVHT